MDLSKINGEIWFDGVDNDGDGQIDEEDETGTTWLERFGTFYGNWSLDKGGFGEYKFDDDGNIIGLNTLISYTAAENIAVSADHIKDLLYNK